MDGQIGALAFRCGAGADERSRAARQSGRRLARDFCAGPNTQMSTRLSRLPDCPLNNTPTAAYTGCLVDTFEDGRTRRALVGVVGFHSNSEGLLVPMTAGNASAALGEPAGSFEGGPVTLSKPITTTQFYVGAHPGIGLDHLDMLIALAPAVVYAGSTTTSRVLTTVPEGEMAECLARAFMPVIPALPTPAGMVTFEWSMDNPAMCRWIGELMHVVARHVAFQPRIIEELEGALVMLREAAAQPITLQAEQSPIT